MLTYLLVALGAASVGYGAAFLLHRRAPAIATADAWLPPAQRRFRIILSTNSGAEARTLYEKVVPREHSDGVVEFWDHTDCRGIKGRKDGTDAAER